MDESLEPILFSSCILKVLQLISPIPSFVNFNTDSPSATTSMTPFEDSYIYELSPPSKYIFPVSGTDISVVLNFNANVGTYTT